MLQTQHKVCGLIPPAQPLVAIIEHVQKLNKVYKKNLLHFASHQLILYLVTRAVFKEAMSDGMASKLVWPVKK